MDQKPHFFFNPADSKYFSGFQSISVAALAAMSENFGFTPPMTQKSLCFYLPDQESRILPRVRERLTKNQDQELESSIGVTRRGSAVPERRRGGGTS